MSSSRSIVLSLLLLCPSIYCFDTGHHYDLTRNALELMSFSRDSDAISIVQLCNYITDWNALSYKVNFPNYDDYKFLANLLHFNNLFNSSMIHDYWIQLTVNQYDVVTSIVNGTMKQKTQTTNDTSQPLLDTSFMLLCSLGYSMHAVQDFYTHSNFINSVVNAKNTNQTSNSTSSNDTCYYTANIYDFQDQDYNLHTYYWPETDSDKEDIAKQWPNIELMKHGDYRSGINKDSYSKQNFDAAYASAFMQCLDTIATWKQWINNDTLWNHITTYNLTREQDIKDLSQGLIAAFEISHYVKQPGFDEKNDGHWKGPDSGRLTATADEVSDFLRDDWQSRSPYQRVFWDTDVSTRLTHHLTQQIVGVNKEITVPSVDETTLTTFKSLTLIHHNPADYQAIIVRTWGAGKWISTPTNDSDQEIDGVYAVVGIDGQEFREATQYQKWTHPYWLSMRFIPSNQTSVVITYDLFIYSSDASNFFQNDQDIEAVIKPSQNVSSPGAIQAQDTNQHISLIYNHQRKKANTMRIQPLETLASQLSLSQRIRQRLAYIRMKSMSLASSIRSSLSTSSSRLMHELNHRASSTDGYTYNDEISPDRINRTTNGVVFEFGTVNEIITSGLPTYLLNRTFSDVNHTLRLQGDDTRVNVAQVNVTLHARKLCAGERERAGNGEAGPALIASPGSNGIGSRPNTAIAATAPTFTIVITFLFVAVKLQ